MRIAILLPRHGDTKGLFTLCLARMLVFSLQADVRSPQGPVKLEIEMFSVSSSDLPENRTVLLGQALEWKADYILWVDGDQTFPPNALLRLMGRRLEVVGCNYTRRAEPLRPTAAKVDADGRLVHVWTTEALAKADTVEEVAHLGLGFCLMETRLFARIRPAVEQSGSWAEWAPFERIRVPGTRQFMMEDVSFFARLGALGVRVHIDHALSWEIGHIADRILTNADAAANRDEFMRSPLAT